MAQTLGETTFDETGNGKVANCCISNIMKKQSIGKSLATEEHFDIRAKQFIGFILKISFCPL